MPSAAVTFLAVASSAVSICSAQIGPLAPPAGSPADTGPSLPQVEPRVDVNALPLADPATNRLYELAPGNYYLTADITVPAGFTGIAVLDGGVDLDLNGFRIKADPGDPGTTGINLGIQTAERGVRIRNGTIYGMRSSGVSGSFSGGSVLEDLRFEDCNTGMTASGVGVVRDCVFFGGSSPVSAGGVVFERCRFTFTSGNSTVGVGDGGGLRDCTMTSVAGGSPEVLLLGVNSFMTGCRFGGFGRIDVRLTGLRHVVVQNVISRDVIDQSGESVVGPGVNFINIGSATNPFANVLMQP